MTAVPRTASGEVVVENPQGMHLRPATEFARAALASGCIVRVRAQDPQDLERVIMELQREASVVRTRSQVIMSRLIERRD